MKIERNDKPLIFSSTSIPDIFFNEYLSEAPGDYIKVYLYMLFLSKYNKDIKINDLSKKLGLSFQTIQDATKYWEEHGVILRKNTGFIINDLQEIEINKLYKPKVALSAEDIKNIDKNKARAAVIENINNKFFQGIMPPSWYSDIDLWFRKYEFDDDVMYSLFNYCYNQGALHKNYIQVVADSWHKSHIKTFEDLDVYYNKQEKLQSLYKTISKKLGYTRLLNEYEKEYIHKWYCDYNYDINVIEIALKRSTSKSNLSFEYYDKILTDWHDRKFKTAVEITDFLNEYKSKKNAVKKLEKKTGYSNYDQRELTDLDKLYSNLKL